jgi:predicted phosphodiesterase
MPEATESGMALELPGGVFIAHTRALLWTHFKEIIAAYRQEKKNGKPPLVLCHGHTHVPSITQFTPPASRLLYINDAIRPQQFQARQACVSLESDCIYLVVPGAFTLEEGRFPTFSFAILDLDTSRVAMVSLKELESLESLRLFQS